MSEIISTPFWDLQNRIIDSEESKVVIAQNISQEILLILEVRAAELPDCKIEKNTIRNYVMSPIFSHVLGYTGKASKDDLQITKNYTASTYVGKTGIEKQYENILSGTPGNMTTQETATGLKKGEKIVSDSIPGDSLIVNIDADLQKTIYDALEKSIKNIGAKRGAAVALNPNTGAVLALVSYPSYDNNIFNKGISQTDFNVLLNDPNQPFFNRAKGTEITDKIKRLRSRLAVIKPTNIEHTLKTRFRQ